MRIKQLKNDRMNYAANQFVIETSNATYFQSYETPCAKYQGGRVFLNRDYFGEDFKGSATTTKHLYIWLRDYAHYCHSDCSAKNIRKLIQEGRITLVAEEELEYAS